MTRVTVVIVNPNSTAAMTDAILRAARQSAPSVAFEGWTSHDGPPAIQGREDGAAATPPLIALADKAAAAGANGFVVGCFDDTALPDLGTRLSCPVIGLGQAAFFYCALRRWRFSVVTTLSVSVPILEENIESYGLAPLLGRVRASEVPVLDLETSPETASARILAEARAAHEEDGVDAIVLGCAGMVHVTAHLRENLPCPIVDPVEAAAGGIAWLTAGNAARHDVTGSCKG